MGLLDSLFGRTKPVPPNLDALFAVPSAAYTLEVSCGLRPTGIGSVCFKAAEGPSAAETRQTLEALVAGDLGTRTAVIVDEYGYSWVTCTRTDVDLPSLVTDLHMVNSTLAEAGFGSSLLCTVLGFAGPTPEGGTPPAGPAQPAGTRHVALVYLYKRGTFYPFVPTGANTRNNAVELEIRAAMAGELAIEPDLNRWFPIWNAPGL